MHGQPENITTTKYATQLPKNPNPKSCPSSCPSEHCPSRGPHPMPPSLSSSPSYDRSLPEPANLERALVQPPEQARPLQQLRRLHRRLRRQYPCPTPIIASATTANEEGEGIRTPSASRAPSSRARPSRSAPRPRATRAGWTTSRAARTPCPTRSVDAPTHTQEK